MPFFLSVLSPRCDYRSVSHVAPSELMSVNSSNGRLVNRVKVREYKLEMRDVSDAEKVGDAAHLLRSL